MGVQGDLRVVRRLGRKERLADQGELTIRESGADAAAWIVRGAARGAERGDRGPWGWDPSMEG